MIVCPFDSKKSKNAWRMSSVLAGFMSETYGITVSFGEWMLVGVPTVAIMLPLTWLVLTRIALPLRLPAGAGPAGVGARPPAAPRPPSPGGGGGKGGGGAERGGRGGKRRGRARGGGAAAPSWGRVGGSLTSSGGRGGVPSKNSRRSG